MFYLKLPITSKSFYKDTKKAAAKFSADLYLVLNKIVDNIQIESFDIVVNYGTEINISHQPTWPNKKRVTRERLFDLNFIENKGGIKTKYLHKIEMTNLEINKFNNQTLPSKFPLNRIYELFKGSNATGAEGKVKSQELVLNLLGEKYHKKPFVNLFKTFTKKNNIFYKKINNIQATNTIDLLEFKNMLNENELYLFEDIWFGAQDKFFYIKPWREWLNNSSEQYNSKLKPLLIREYGLKDQLYKQYVNSSVVQACHLKPKSHIIEDENLSKKEKQKEIDDINNGLLLPVHIHKYLDNGTISFDQEGKVIYSKSKKLTKFLEKSEVKILDLDNYKLEKDLLTPDRIKYLNYHRNNVYQIGI